MHLLLAHIRVYCHHSSTVKYSINLSLNITGIFNKKNKKILFSYVYVCVTVYVCMRVCERVCVCVTVFSLHIYIYIILILQIHYN